MGCAVNGFWRTKLADIGYSLPGTGEVPVCPVYVDGENRLVPARASPMTQRIVADYGQPLRRPQAVQDCAHPAGLSAVLIRLPNSYCID